MTRNGLDRVEEAVGLLRALRPGEWLLYALGAVPLNLGLLLLVRDVSAGYGEALCLRDSLLCVAAFWWASFWKARFAAALFDRLSGIEGSERNAVWECVLVQGVLQSFKLVLLPLAAVSIVPMPFFSALFRNVNLEANRPGAGMGAVLKNASARATYGGRQNWTALLICSVGGLVVFANVFFLVLTLPQLLQAFTGTENEWTRRYTAGGNASLFAIAVALTWLVIDPVLQAYAAAGSFYFEARKDGRDLLVRLRRASAAAVVVLCCMLFSSGQHAGAAEAKRMLTAEDVRRGVQEATSSREFAWVHERVAKASSDDWFATRILRDLQRATDAIGAFFDRLGEWWQKLFGKRTEIKDASDGPVRANAHRVQWLYYTGAAFCVAVAATFLLQRRRKRTPVIRGGMIGAAGSAGSVEDVLATEKPEEEWLGLAREFAAKGEWRFAIRAMYLANLSYLAAAELLRITKSKSNAIYERELRNRCRTEPVCVAFTRSNREYERVWYGMHDVTPELRESFEQAVTAIRGAHG